MNERELSDIGGGCILPLLQAVVTGALVGLTVGAMADAISLENAIAGGLAVGATAAACQWLYALSTWRAAVFGAPVYPVYEPEAEPDEEPQEQPVAHVEIKDGNSRQFVDLPATVEQLTSLAAGLLSGQSLSEAAWTGAGGVFSRTQFSQLRAELIKRGLAVWNSPSTPARGAMLTAPGRAVMRHYASMAGDATNGGVLQRAG